VAGRVLAETVAAPARIDWPATLKEAGLAALVAFVLFLPLIGMQTINAEGGVGLRFRFDWVLIGTAAVFAGRLLLIGARGVPSSTISTATAPLRQIPGLISPYRRLLAFAGVFFAFIMPFLPFANRYVVDIGTTVLIYVMLGWGLNIVVGLAGLLDLGYVAFYAVGAYSFALFAQWFELGFWECLPIAGALAASFGVLLGFPVLRLRGDYLAIVTLGFGEIIRIILLNWWAVTRGPDGLSNIPRPTLFGLVFERSPPEGVTAFHEFFGIHYSSLQRVTFLYFLILLLALITNLFVTRIRKLPIGRAWEALREDEIACRALGINPTNTKLTAFALGAMFGGFAGSFFATRQGFISPESFTFIESATVLAIVVLGGMGSQIGVVLAAMVLVLLPEFGREFAQYRMLLFGAAMVAIMVWRPRGLLAHREPTIRLHGTAPIDAGGPERP
jgi:branched-chain amino acid transport system permease protein